MTTATPAEYNTSIRRHSCTKAANVQVGDEVWIDGTWRTVSMIETWGFTRIWTLDNGTIARRALGEGVTVRYAVVRCTPGHDKGSKPQLSPVPGLKDAEGFHLYTVHHGMDYLDATGRITMHPVRMPIHTAQAAIALHDEAVRA